ncbi:MAG: sulfite exporter TauE/SafE family protein [Novosphingobium sp.]|uniref:sulfite exporter TauE/SafE family protein n=1 Tax=Novosphingobium sp. TaxID=1874826 RepID=UPI00260CEBC8|nr:sulfite exporter TauE/SafE family protein [Novosphingobium sp.]MCP5387336.1 sulfite exporter TauE/SafE family protein [Novosphingobium sp.]
MALLTDPLTLILALVAVFLLGLAKGGFAGLGALATPLLALAMPPVTAAAVLLPVLLVQDVVSVWTFRHSWDRWIVGWMLPGAAIGVAAAAWLASAIPEERVLALLGAVTFCFGVYRLWIERGGRFAAASSSPGWVGMLFGAATGFTSQIAHAGGPPFQMWVTPRKLDHLSYVGTSAILFAAINWMKVPSYLALGTLNRTTLTMAAILMPLAIGSTFAGVWLVRRIDAARFYAIIYWLMVALGLRLVWQGLA